MIPFEGVYKAKILIVDDLEANILLLKQILGEAGYTDVSSTRGGFPVRELHRKNRYDLILLDLHMPGQDGFEVMESLKEIETGAYLPVLVVTAQPDQKMRALKAGARDFIGKPFDMAELLFRVRNMLEARLLHAKLTGQDAAGRARSEEALRQYGERYKLAARVLSDVVWDWNLLDQTLWWSDGFLTPFGFKAGEIAPSFATWTEHMHPEERVRVTDGIGRAIADGADGNDGAESWSAEYRFRHKDGSYSDVKDHGFILRDDAGRAIRMVGGMRDISRQKSGEAERRNSGILEDFAARAPGLADELNSALAPLLPALEMLKSGMGAGLENPGNRENLDNLFSHAGRGAELARELLALAGGFRGAKTP